MKSDTLNYKELKSKYAKEVKNGNMSHALALLLLKTSEAFLEKITTFEPLNCSVNELICSQKTSLTKESDISSALVSEIKKSKKMRDKMRGWQLENRYEEFSLHNNTYAIATFLSGALLMGIINETDIVINDGNFEKLDYDWADKRIDILLPQLIGKVLEDNSIKKH